MKTVSLVEALASGKKFRFKMPKEETWITVSNGVDTGWSKAAILHAECQIIDEPREIWVWEDPVIGFLRRGYASKAECESCNQPAPGRPVKFREVLDE